VSGLTRKEVNTMAKLTAAVAALVLLLSTAAFAADVELGDIERSEAVTAQVLIPAPTTSDEEAPREVNRESFGSAEAIDGSRAGESFIQ